MVSLLNHCDLYSNRGSCPAQVVSFAWSAMNVLLIHYESLSSRRILCASHLVRRCLYLIEFVLGWRPFRLDYPADANEAQLKISPIGCCVMLTHLLSFLAAAIDNFMYAEDPEDTDDPDNVTFTFIFKLAIIDA